MFLQTQMSIFVPLGNFNVKLFREHSTQKAILPPLNPSSLYLMGYLGKRGGAVSTRGGACDNAGKL